MKILTAKGFLAKANAKVSATAFLAEHKAWLLTGTRRLLTEPILIKLEKGEIFPTPALQEIKQAVMSHEIAFNILQGESKMSEAKTTSPYTVTIYDGDKPVTTKSVTKDKDGKEKVIDKPMIMNFDMGQRAEEWAARRLTTEGGSSWRAEIRENVTGKIRVMDRDKAFSRLVSVKHTPTMRVVGSKHAPRTMSGKPKVKGDKYYYPT
jgi:siroheme synthase